MARPISAIRFASPRDPRSTSCTANARAISAQSSNLTGVVESELTITLGRLQGQLAEIREGKDSRSTDANTRIHPSNAAAGSDGEKMTSNYKWQPSGCHRGRTVRALDGARGPVRNGTAARRCTKR